MTSSKSFHGNFDGSSNTISNVTVNGVSSGNTFTVSDDTKILADVIAIVAEETNDEFNIKGSAVIVGGTAGDFSTYSGLYSIMAAQATTPLNSARAALLLITASARQRTALMLSKLTAPSRAFALNRF